jgi:long-chain-acyl-CoA dehydrogenase
MMRRSVFGEDHGHFSASVRDFLVRAAVPHVDRFIEDRAISREFWRQAGNQGMLGLETPAAYGGGEAGDYRFNAVAIEINYR